MTQNIDIRLAIKLAVDKHRYANETKNHDMRQLAKRFIRNHWHLRNTGIQLRFAA